MFTCCARDELFLLLLLFLPGVRRRLYLGARGETGGLEVVEEGWGLEGVEMRGLEGVEEGRGLEGVKLVTRQLPRASMAESISSLTGVVSLLASAVPHSSPDRESSLEPGL